MSFYKSRGHPRPKSRISIQERFLFFVILHGVDEHLFQGPGQGPLIFPLYHYYRVGGPPTLDPINLGASYESEATLGLVQGPLLFCDLAP